jgi:hypothetical protein
VFGGLKIEASWLREESNQFLAHLSSDDFVQRRIHRFPGRGCTEYLSRLPGDISIYIDGCLWHARQSIYSPSR